MKLSHRIFIVNFLIVATAGLFLLLSVRDELRPAVRQSLEETLIDTANLLAEIVEKDVGNGTIQTSDFSHAVEKFLSRKPAAKIWGLKKNSTTYRIYITDQTGIVIYDSESGRAVGEDYSKWNDVYLTLQGKYGARSTQSNSNDPTSTVMYVAAPIKHNHKIIGVLTVSKPNISVLPFIQLSQRNIARAAILLFAIAIILSWIFAGFLTRSTRKLAEYANKVRDGEKAILPDIPEPELSQLGQAIESMRVTLEGKEYVEQYVHSLTHEIKSPLSGIRGASELLSEDMDTQNRSRFIGNIKEDARRIQNIVDRLLDLAKLEQQQTLEQDTPFDIQKMVTRIVDSHESVSLQKSLTYTLNIEPSTLLHGDPFLVRQAIDNLIVNAIDFSPTQGVIEIKGIQLETKYQLSIQDQGSGIPLYAKDKIFERFYSLPRPDSGKKSSGLGLGFVQEVMKLHHGDLKVSSNSKGCLVRLTFRI